MNKVCMFCGVEMKRLIESPNDIYGADDPRGYGLRYDGETFCPKCRGGNCGVSIPLTKKDIENLRDWFKHNPQDLEKCIPVIQEAFKNGVFKND